MRPNLAPIVGAAAIAVAALALFLVFAPARAQEAQPAAVDATITLTAAADVTVDSATPETNREGEAEVRVLRNRTTAVVDAYTLVRFDLDAIPPGSIINRAELRLAQRSGSTAAQVDAYRIITAWNSATVTWNTHPLTTAAGAAAATLPSGGSTTATWDVTDIVRAWRYTFAVNHGVLLRYPDGGSTQAHTFSALEGESAPTLFVDYTPPPASVTVPAGGPITLDGDCQRTEWTGAASYPFADLNGFIGAVRLRHDQDSLYVCVQGIAGTFVQRFFGVYVDTDNGREQFAQAEDVAYRVRVVDDALSRLTGNGQGGYTAGAPAGFDAGAAALQAGDSAEFAIDVDQLPCGQTFGLGVYHQSITDQTVDYGWPARESPGSPATWVAARLQSPTCPIRVCLATAVPCAPAAGAQVRHAGTGETYALDGQGYVADRAALADGAAIWATLVITPGELSTIYHTSGAPQTVGPAAYASPVPGQMTLVVTPRRPLMVHDLTVAAQWNVEGDPAYRDELAGNLQKASRFLYDFTDGQVALGEVTVYQNYENWDAADVWLYASNHMRPEADAGGVVEAETADPRRPEDLFYYPGRAYMGATWNRFNLPGMPPELDPNTEDDWAKVLAHELGHYLLFLFDTYFRIGPDRTVENVYTCTGSAMGWVYDDLNTEFVFDQGDWDANCADTFGGNVLPGETEWETIRLWHPWSVAPTVLDAGPASQPAGLTVVSFAPSTAPPPLLDQLFTLDYQAGEAASPEARAFLFRNAGGLRIIDQGKPAEGATEIELHGAQVGDRFCVIDIDTVAEAPGAPRNQFGCETLEAGDDTLALKRDASWAPVILLDPLTSTSMAISVEQPSAGEVIRAALYPEHEAGPTEIVLSATEDGFQGVFELDDFTYAAYVQVYVDEAASETDPRREAVVDFGVGGGALPGPATKIGHAPVVSSDGRAAFILTESIELKEGEFIALQSMAGAPRLPPGAMPLSQPYRLISLPPSLVTSGVVTLRFLPGGGAAQAQAAPTPAEQAQDAPDIWFWNGQIWTRLPTTVVAEPDGFELASAASRGEGIYMLLEQGQPNYLPIIGRQ